VTRSFAPDGTFLTRLYSGCSGSSRVIKELAVWEEQVSVCCATSRSLEVGVIADESTLAGSSTFPFWASGSAKEYGPLFLDAGLQRPFETFHFSVFNAHRTSFFPKRCQ
jgi:hypothetical protein